MSDPILERESGIAASVSDPNLSNSHPQSGRVSPTVSVLMPVHNGQLYLPQAVESVLSQTFKDFEFIAIDDGSTDDSLLILREYERRDSRVQVLSRPNTGIVGALNDGLELATGEFVARMDADDIALSERLAKQVAFLRAHPECVLVGSRVLLIDPEGAPIGEWATQTAHEDIDGGHLTLHWPMVHPAVTMRRSIVMQLGGYRQQYNTLEDLDLFLRMAERGRLANLPDVLLHYRQHFGSTCFSRNRQQSDIREAIYRETCARRGMPEPASAPETFRAAPRSENAERHRWAWMALESGHVSTARKHAFGLMRRVPLSIESWKLLYCALRGH